MKSSRAKHRKAREAPGERPPWVTDSGLEIKPHGTNIPEPRYAGRIDTHDVRMSDGTLARQTAPVARKPNKKAIKKKTEASRKSRTPKGRRKKR